MPTMSRLVQSVPRLSVQASRQLSFSLPQISTLDSLKASGGAFHGLYSNKTINDLWFERGQSLAKKLNSQLEELKVENAPSEITELIALTFSKPELRSIYTNASMLYNLQFCLESLKPGDGAATDSAQHVKKQSVSALFATPSISTKVENEPKDQALQEWIEDSFGSMAEFRTLILNSAKAIKGDGITWLVAQATYSDTALRGGSQAEVTFTKLGVMNTYNAGIVDDSIRSGQMSKLRQEKKARRQAALKRQQERDEAEGTTAADTKIESIDERHSDVVLGSVEEAREALVFSDKKLVPLLAIDGSMRAYLNDYGVFGKQQYLDNVWRCIDWDVVAKRTPSRFKPSVAFD